MWTQQFIKTNRGNFEIFVKGKGLPMCITHMYSEYNHLGNQFANLFTEHYKVFLVNLRGAGKSEPVESEEQMGFEEAIKDLEAIRNELNITQWGFAGYSAGGMLGMAYALRYEKSLTKLIVCSSSASYRYVSHPDSIFCKEHPKNPRLMEILSIMNDSKSSMDNRIKANREWSMMSLYRPEKLDEYFSKPSSGSSVPKLLHHFAYKEVSNFDITKALHKIIIPTTVIGGLYDVQCPFEFCEEIAREIPNSKLYTFEESNHAPYVEEEEKFAQVIASI